MILHEPYGRMFFSLFLLENMATAGVRCMELFPSSRKVIYIYLLENVTRAYFDKVARSKIGGRGGSILGELRLQRIRL